MRKNAHRRFSAVVLIEDIETLNEKLGLPRVLLVRPMEIYPLGSLSRSLRHLTKKCEAITKNATFPTVRKKARSPSSIVLAKINWVMEPI